MSLEYYFDHNMKRAIAGGLRGRGVDLLLAGEDGRAQLGDELLIERSTELGRVFVSEDEDFLVITARWLQSGRSFAGFIRAPQQLGIGIVIADLELIAKCSEPAEFVDRVEILPFR